MAKEKQSPEAQDVQAEAQDILDKAREEAAAIVEAAKRAAEEAAARCCSPADCSQRAVTASPESPPIAACAPEAPG